MTDHAREAAAEIDRDFICGRGIVLEPEWRHAKVAELAALIRPHIDAATADLRAENERLRKFVADAGTTYSPCEVCGHAMSGKCLWCECERLKQEVEQLKAQWAGGE